MTMPDYVVIVMEHGSSPPRFTYARHLRGVSKGRQIKDNHVWVNIGGITKSVQVISRAEHSVGPDDDQQTIPLFIVKNY